MAAKDVVSLGIGPVTVGWGKGGFIEFGLGGPTPFPAASPLDIIPMGIGSGTDGRMVQAFVLMGLQIAYTPPPEPDPLVVSSRHSLVRPVVRIASVPVGGMNRVL